MLVGGPRKARSFSVHKLVTWDLATFVHRSCCLGPLSESSPAGKIHQRSLDVTVITTGSRG
jgi:hypothetical protein